MNTDYTKSPRLFIDNDLSENVDISLSKDHAHYLMTVMRKEQGEIIRIFNGRDGEFIGELSPDSKKHASLVNLRKIKDQPQESREIHLYFAPIKKDRMAFMIEKAVELGVTDIHPLLTIRTENRKPNMEKIEAYIIEASEQCERMDIPKLHPLRTIETTDFYNPTFAAIERGDHELFETSEDSLGIFVGPEGGWTDKEKDTLINQPEIEPVSLGNNVLRAETASLFMLARIVK